jgi:hypothetical protein
MRVVLDTNVLVSAALKQQSMSGMAALVVERRGGLRGAALAGLRSIWREGYRYKKAGCRSA